VTEGSVRAGNATEATYWQLVDDELLSLPIDGVGQPKAPDLYRIVGETQPRLDLKNRVTGKSRFLHDLSLPGMVHGRVVRPPTYSSRLVDVDVRNVESLPGVIAVVQSGSFLGVVALREEQAVSAAEALRGAASWNAVSDLLEEDALFDRLLETPGVSRLIVDGAPIEGDVPEIAVPAQAAATVQATYTRPYQMHGALGPSAAAARFDDDDTGSQLSVWTHSQGVHPLRSALSQALGLEESRIRVQHVEGAGCYGHNGADDAALDASLLARALPRRAVLLKWSREDEHRWEPYGSCGVVNMQGSVDASGTVVDWNHDVYSYTHGGRPRRSEGSSGLMAAWHMDPPLPAPVPGPGGGSHGGIHRNADPLYAFGRRRVVKHFVPDSPLRVSALRGLGSFANVFAIESFMDELALAAETDPVAFRLRHLADDSRSCEVIEAAAATAGWEEGVRRGGEGDGRGKGIGFARYKNEKAYVAVVAEVRVDVRTGLIRLEKMSIAGDVGQIVNPDGVINQLEGGAVQSASWTLKEAVRFGPEGIRSVDWESYPVLSFGEAPEVETVLIDRPGEPSLGCGEATQGPVPAAIANAVFDAIGVRMRDVPFTEEKVTQGMEERERQSNIQ